MLENDSIWQEIGALPAVAPDAARAAAVRAKCQARLERTADRSTSMLEPAVAALCAAYVVQLARLLLTAGVRL